MKALPLFHLIAGKPVIVLGEGDGADAKRRLVERAGGIVVGDDDRDARLAFISLDNPALAVTRLRARGVLVNVVDLPELCDFTVPAVVDRDPVIVAVGTGGASAGLAKHLRLRLEALLPANLGRLAETLHGARDWLRSRWPDPAARRRVLDSALAEHGALDPLAWRGDEDVTARLAEGESLAGPATVELTIATDDPDELTLRQARVLGAADAVMFEPGIAPAILDRARADAVRLPLPHEGVRPQGQVLVLRRG